MLFLCKRIFCTKIFHESNLIGSNIDIFTHELEFPFNDIGIHLKIIYLNLKFGEDLFRKTFKMAEPMT